MPGLEILDERTEKLDELLRNIYPKDNFDIACFQSVHSLASFPESWRDTCLSKIEGLLQDKKMSPIFNNSSILEMILHVNNINSVYYPETNTELSRTSEQLIESLMSSHAFVYLPRSFFLSEELSKKIKDCVEGPALTHPAEYFYELQQTLPVFTELSEKYSLSIEEKTIFFLNLMGLNPRKIEDYLHTIKAHTRIQNFANTDTLEEKFFSSLSMNYRKFFTKEELEDFPKSLVAESIVNTASSPFATDKFFKKYQNTISTIESLEPETYSYKELSNYLNASIVGNFLHRVRGNNCLLTIAEAPIAKHIIMLSKRTEIMRGMLLKWLWFNAREKSNDKYFSKSYKNFLEKYDTGLLTDVGLKRLFCEVAASRKQDPALENLFYDDLEEFLEDVRQSQNPKSFLDYYFAVDNLQKIKVEVHRQYEPTLNTHDVLAFHSSFFGALITTYGRDGISRTIPTRNQNYDEEFTINSIEDATLQILDGFILECSLFSSTPSDIVIGNVDSNFAISPGSASPARQRLLENPFLLNDFLDSRNLTRKQKVTLLKQVRELLDY